MQQNGLLLLIDPEETNSRRAPLARDRKEMAVKKFCLCLVMLWAALVVGASSAAAGNGKCAFDSDCPSNVKCNSGRCATARGGKCAFDSDCGGNGARCYSGKCSNAPDGKCSFNSDCPGGRCDSGKCKR
jgi:hypothetical protein